jgi:hypothetical protein
MDAYLVVKPKSGVSGDQLKKSEGGSESTRTLPDGSLAYFTGVRFHEWQDSAPEERIRITLAALPGTWFEHIEPRALVVPDTWPSLDAATWLDIEGKEGAIPVEFLDYAPNDPRFGRALEDDFASLMEGVHAMTAYGDYASAHPEFTAEMQALARQKRIADMIARTRQVESLAPFVDALVKHRHFENLITLIPIDLGDGD